MTNADHAALAPLLQSYNAALCRLQDMRAGIGPIRNPRLAVVFATEREVQAKRLAYLDAKRQLLANG